MTCLMQGCEVGHSGVNTWAGNVSTGPLEIQHAEAGDAKTGSHSSEGVGMILSALTNTF